MDKKYYTPEQNEFYSGFECEKKPYYYEEFRYGEFENYITQIADRYMLMELKKGNVRVKYLDREDIEKLGWKYDEGDIRDAFKLGKWQLSFLNNSEIIIHQGKSIYFIGSAKNISELRKLMTQLQIS